MNNMSNEYFDSMAMQWDDNPMRRELAKAVWNFIENSVVFNDGMEAIDFGCGTGLLSVLLSERVKSVYALDASVGMLGRLCEKIDRQGISNIRTVHHDITSDEPLKIAVDLAVSAMALHHIDDTAEAVGKLASYLKPGGRILLVDLFSEDGSFHTDVEVFHDGFEPADIEKLLTSNGLRIVKSEKIFEMKKNDAVYPVFGICGEKVK
jgi:ubiquinone/menaquinone biosynthesis C-methylase UbiE